MCLFLTIRDRNMYIKYSSGVPHVSYLDPLLFLIFLNDPFKINRHSNILLYANDVKLFKIISNIDDTTVVMLLSWTRENVSQWTCLDIQIGKIYILSMALH